MSMLDVLTDFARTSKKRSFVEQTLAALNESDYLSLIQGYSLAAVAESMHPDVILDLGTGPGNSAAVFSISRPDAAIYTFDLEDHWSKSCRDVLSRAGVGANVKPSIGDLTKVNFGPVLAPAGCILVFCDAHGFDVASHVLGHIMPLIAEKNHIVICHDMSHKNFANMEYEGKPFWRGMNMFGSPPGQTAYVVLGWVVSAVDQVIPITDFCARNDIEFHSFDTDIHIEGTAESRSELQRMLQLNWLDAIHMGYFSMRETKRRNFPRASVQS
jgi:predicted O-methyltransferase YrrM